LDHQFIAVKKSDLMITLLGVNGVVAVVINENTRKN